MAVVKAEAVCGVAQACLKGEGGKVYGMKSRE